MNKFWLYLNSSTFIWTKGSKGIIYNTDNYKSFSYENVGIIKLLSKKLSNIENLYCITIFEKNLTPEVTEWIECIKKTNAGGLIHQSISKLKPISYFPILNLQSDVSKLDNSSKSPYRYQNEYLNRIIIYLNGDFNGADNHYKQFIFPTKTSKTLQWDKLHHFLEVCNQAIYLQSINLCGDIFKYDSWPQIKTFLSNINIEVCLYIKLETLFDNQDLIQSFVKKEWQINVIVDQIDDTQIACVNNQLNNYSSTWHFITYAQDNISKIESTIKQHNISNIEIVPIYIGTNIKFFQKLVFLTEKDILSTKWTKQQIFAHQVMNTSFFGQITILPDGRIYSNVNFTPIGNMSTPINSVLKKLMKKNSPWFLIRKKTPCKNCVYCWLCPSISNYELIMGKQNLCKINI